MTLFYFQNKWQISTQESWNSQSQPLEFTSKSNYRYYLKPFGSINKNENIPSFETIFWDLWNALQYKFPKEKNYCFSFQMISHHFPSISRYSKENLLLHGVKNKETLEDMDFLEIANTYHWNVISLIQTYSNLNRASILSTNIMGNGTTNRNCTNEISPIDEIWNLAKELDPIQCEGFIIYDRVSKFRLFIPSHQFLLLQKLEKENTAFWSADSRTNDRLMTDLIRMNSHTQFLQFFPQWAQLYQKIKLKYDALTKKILEVYKELQSFPTQSFGKEAKKFSFYGVLFELREVLLDPKNKEMRLETAIQLVFREALLKRLIQLIEENQKKARKENKESLFQ